MILDSIKNAGMYASIHPRFKQAFEFLSNTDLMQLPLGKTELDGDNLFVSVVEIQGKTSEIARMETHNRYIDIQVPLTAKETMGWIDGNNLKEVTEPYNADKDISFFADKAANLVVVQPGEFVVFFPSDGHQPGIAEGVFRKIIIKVLV